MSQTIEQLTYSVPGVSCGHCRAAITAVAALSLAALGLLNPVIAGAATAFSTVSVVTNALRLRRFRTRRTEAAGATVSRRSGIALGHFSRFDRAEEPQRP